MNQEPWLRSPLPDIVDELQPVAAMFVAAKEDILRAVEGLGHDELWKKPNGAASIGFHIIHLAGATDRLMSYAEGAVLTDAQKADLAAERDADAQRPTLDVLTQQLATALDAAVKRLEGISSADLATARELGRAKVPTSMRALILHAGEHAARHAGQIVTTVMIARTRV